MVYSREEFRKYQLLVCVVARAVSAEASKEIKQTHPVPLSYLLPPSQLRSHLKQ